MMLHWLYLRINLLIMFCELNVKILYIGKEKDSRKRKLKRMIQSIQYMVHNLTKYMMVGKMGLAIHPR